MLHPFRLILLSLVFAGGTAAAAFAAGPDVIVADLDLVMRWSRIGDITSYSVGTHSCNIGNAPLNWQAGNNQHPVISQNMFRLKDGRFEQIGQAWLKHGFAATNESLCSPCSNPGGDPGFLFPNCSDPYTAGLNAVQAGLGPRSEVNAATGSFPFPFGGPPADDGIDKRLQVHDSDLEPALNQGALYFVESQYIAADDAASGNDNNNNSYRRITISETPPNSNTYVPAVTAATQQQRPAIQAWQDNDPSVALQAIDVSGDGRIIVAAKATNLGNGFWRYEYAVQNINSDRSVGSFAVAVHPEVGVPFTGFHDVDYHSGEPYSLTDWPGSFAGSAVTWTTESFGTNSNANAIRFGTLYNFRFDVNSPPVSNTQFTIGLFKPGSPNSVSGNILGPSSAAPDCNGNSTPDYIEIQGNPSLDCDGNHNLDECDFDCNGNDIPDACDITADPMKDCNNNGKLDVCEILIGTPAPGGPFFCTSGCDPDCNTNGKPDACDISSGIDPDCNGNGIPDSCDLAAGRDTDCNGNARPDHCEIPVGSPAPGGPFYCTSSCNPDCNVNGKPDDCDITAGVSLDCNTNQLPDECEIAATPAIDCNRNGRIDSCGEVDCNGNLTPDDCEGPACTGILRGDMNCSATVTTVDIPEFTHYIVHNYTSCRADMNGDGVLNAVDVILFTHLLAP